MGTRNMLCYGELDDVLEVLEARELNADEVRALLINVCQRVRILQLATAGIARDLAVEHQGERITGK